MLPTPPSRRAPWRPLLASVPDCPNRWVPLELDFLVSDLRVVEDRFAVALAPVPKLLLFRTSTPDSDQTEDASSGGAPVCTSVSWDDCVCDLARGPEVGDVVTPDEAGRGACDDLFEDMLDTRRGALAVVLSPGWGRSVRVRLPSPSCDAL